MNIDERAKVFPVYYHRGVFYTWDDKSPTKERKYSRAPFNFIQIEKVDDGAVEEYIMPSTDPRAGSPESWPDTWQTGHELDCFGYATDRMIFIEEHEMGSFDTDDGKPWNLFELGYA